jgi:hypothetical protein
MSARCPKSRRVAKIRPFGGFRGARRRNGIIFGVSITPFGPTADPIRTMATRGGLYSQHVRKTLRTHHARSHGSHVTSSISATWQTSIGHVIDMCHVANIDWLVVRNYADVEHPRAVLILLGLVARAGKNNMHVWYRLPKVRPSRFGKTHLLELRVLRG